MKQRAAMAVRRGRALAVMGTATLLRAAPWKAWPLRSASAFPPPSIPLADSDFTAFSNLTAHCESLLG